MAGAVAREAEQRVCASEKSNDVPGVYVCVCVCARARALYVCACVRIYGSQDKLPI